MPGSELVVRQSENSKAVLLDNACTILVVFRRIVSNAGKIVYRFV